LANGVNLNFAVLDENNRGLMPDQLLLELTQ
jgi:hypothetical protein